MGHAVPVEVVVVQPNSDDMSAVVKLADAHRSILGHMPWGALQSFAEQGRILAAKVDDEVAGYTLYDIARERVRVIHLCVAAEFRSRKVARALAEDLSARHQDLRGIFLKCRRDFPANQMWPSLGFELRAEVPGRGRESKPLCCWWRSHGHPDLFSEGVGDAETLVAIDHNVFLDLITDRPGTGPEEARVLDSDWLRGAIRLAITRETHNEIDKNSSAEERARQRSVLGRFREMDYPPEREAEVRRAFDKRIPSEQIPLKDKPDVRHIISAAAGGARILVTRDEKMIERYAEAAAESLGLRVLLPSDFADHQDEVTSAARYRPVELQGTAYRVSDCGAETEPALLDFLDNAGGERKSVFKALLREQASDPNTHRRWVRDPTGRALAVWATRMESEERALVVPLLRVHAHEATGVTIGRRLLQSIKTEALDAGADRIWITDQHLHRGFVSDLEDDGFFQADDPPRRVAAVLDAR
jgi:GNAT superfamily N-acetyltransferase